MYVRLFNSVVQFKLRFKLRSFTLSEIKCQATSLIEGYLEIQYAFIIVGGSNDQRKFSRSFSVNAPLR